MNIKELFRKIHLWLGLVSGIVVFIVSVTGALYVFKDEIESVTQSYRKVASQNKEILSPSQVIALGKKAMPNTEIHGVVYKGADDAVEVVYYQESPLFYGAAFFNPYSGEQLGTQDYIYSFFGLVLYGHTYLWLPPVIGEKIVAASVLIFLVMVITGLILWWPRNGREGALKFSKNATPSVKRLELHKIAGFYSLWFILILILTGMVWAFGGFERAIYKGLGGEKEIAFSYPQSDTTKVNIVQLEGDPLDIIWNKVKAEFPIGSEIEIHALHSDKDPVFVELNRDPSTYWKMDYLFYDQHTLKEIEPKHAYGRFDQAGTPEIVRRLNYDVHTGSIGGMLGKILAFVVSLFAASLPVTGFRLWWVRRQEKKKFKKSFNISSDSLKQEENVLEKKVS